jgi:hypothetical protein
MTHGASAAGLPPSSYEANLDFYLGSSYALGAFLPLGVVARLLGQEVAWFYQPCIAVWAAVLALALYSLSATALSARPGRAAVAFLASQPALVYAYALWDGAKEVAGALCSP